MSATYQQRVKDYRAAMVLVCLHRAGEPQTAAEISEHATALAMAEGHAKEFWAALSPQTVHGILRQLQSAGFVTSSGQKHSARYGRSEPLWHWASGTAACPSIPEPPDAEEEPAARAVLALAQPTPVDPLESLTREQLLALLQVRTDGDQLIEKFISDMKELASRAVRIAGGSTGIHG